MSTEALKVLIVGAGFGGLTAAIECRKRGFSVILFEGNQTRRQLGDIISFGSNSGRIFHSWPGIEEKLDLICHHSDGLHFRTYDDEFLCRQTWGAEADWGKRFNGHRGEIHEVCWNHAIEVGVEIRLGCKVQEYLETETEAGVVVNGERVVGDVVLAGDGVRSLARTIVLGFEDKPKSSGYAVYRAWMGTEGLKKNPSTAWLANPEKDLHVGWLGPDVHFLVATLQKGTACSWVLTHKDEADVEESWSAPGYIDDAIKAIPDWAPICHDIIRATPQECVVDWKLVFRDPLPTWITVPVRATPHVAQRLTNTKTPDNSQTSTPRNSITMAPIDDAIATIESLEPGEHFSYRAIARDFGVAYSTLTRRHKGRQRPREAKDRDQQILNSQQELELVQYIENLTKRGLPPTREMIKNLASQVATESVSDSWVNRFLHRQGDHLVSKWSSGMDSRRHKADSYVKYELYFDLLLRKMRQYNIQPSHTYNMDEKGFMIGVTGRSKRVFSRRQWESKEVQAPLQDGSRKWITLLAAVCADGSALPPGLIFQASSESLQSTWVADVKAGKHNVFITSSPSGWTNNDVGLAWLEQVFNRCTKQKARQGRDWRLLILDGHGSHLTKEFIDYCDSHRILLAVFPPHSTHTLQPLDVAMFKPLSAAYSKELSTHLQKTQGLIAVKKGDFFPLFWRAWESSFKTETILKSFEATGIWPMEPEAILKRFQREGSREQDEGEADPSAPKESDWRQMERLVRSAVRDTAAEESKSLSQTLHRLQVQNELLHHENDGLREALTAKKKHKKRGKPLDLQQREEYHGGAVFWSLRKIREARARETVKQQEEHEEQLAKANRKELQAAAKLYREQQAQERRVAREAAKVVREREKAKKEAARAARIEAQNTKRASKTTQNRKRKALTPPLSKPKRQRRGGGSAAVAASPEAAPEAPPKINSRGRTINLPRKYK